ncbi:perlwapin-like isoform X2 [Rhinatrema bivittatum]|uniref:perlwapin-like isoform X2 n=1 Tax=Rhinatrema bivittatum TaxID=194408 RepID=UPI00112C6FB5|nr:perlwapin-like isoform X2 [Rhinatrema bivittatum]XP_029452243.1 perlwapin-like isoform X2 [Rhinatrema bivittatum]XP_029452244.1 perlwapin-like isoform X2 [Rhinatrema bivittatum]
MISVLLFCASLSLVPLCRSDSECQPNEKCCLFGCRRQCVTALAVKPGMCPDIMAKCAMPLPLPRCRTDGDCPLTQKCCTLCGKVCLMPKQEHDGVCPPHLGAPQPCRYNSSAKSCRYDWNCAADQKCCFSGYMKQCVASLAEKPGHCRYSGKDVQSKKDQCLDKCRFDRDCPANEKCCMGTEGHVCLKPASY